MCAKERAMPFPALGLITAGLTLAEQVLFGSAEGILI